MAKTIRQVRNSNNILMSGLGPILSRKEIYQHLTHLPEIPKNVSSIPKYERLHDLYILHEMYIPSLEGVRLYETIDLLLRHSYRYRDPHKASTWSVLGGEPFDKTPLRAPAMAAANAGHSGTGKTQSTNHALGSYPRQIILHDSFPNIVGPHPQVVWLSVEVPSSGKATDLADNLMTALDDALKIYVPDYIPRFEAILAKDCRHGLKMLNEWRQVALSYFLGLLHLDEVQNFFKLATLKSRRKNNSPNEAPELSIVEDQCLRWILSLLNTWQIPVVFSGTLDGIGALTKRLSTAERIMSGGYHKFTPFTLTSRNFDLFFKQLIQYQYVKDPLSDSDQFRQLIIDLTAGVPRIIIALWIAAHRVAFERKDDDLRLTDFKKAANTYLAPLKPAVTALASNDPVLMAKYDDLLPRDNGIWSSFWDSSI